MMKSAAFALLLLSVSVANAAVTPVLDPHDGSILPLSVQKRLLSQCSRGAPQGVTGIWSPNVAQIRELELRLPRALDAAAVNLGKNNQPPDRYVRQYAGFLVGARKIIYLNALPYEVAQPRTDSPAWRQKFDWRKQVMNVCDGGAAFFGAEYDPATKSFDHFEFNGLA